MATRINTTFWGAESTWRSTNNYNNWLKVPMTLYADVVYNHQSDLLNKDYDKSTSLWGIPYDASVAMNTTVSWYWNSGMNIEYKEPHSRVNVPVTVFAATNSATPVGDGYNRNAYPASGITNRRTAPNVSLANSSGTRNFDNGPSISYSHVFSTTVGGDISSPVTYSPPHQCVYYDYRQHIGFPLLSVIPKNVINSSKAIYESTADDILNNRWNAIKTENSITNDEDILICGAGFMITHGIKDNASQSDRTTSGSGTPIYMPMCDTEPSTRAKPIFYSANEPPFKSLISVIYNIIGIGSSYSYTTHNLPYVGETGLPTATTFFHNRQTVYYSTHDVMRDCDQIFRISRKKQKFSDVEYHWDIMLNYGGNPSGGSLHLLEESDLSGLSTANTAYISMIPVLIIDDKKGSTYKQSILNAIIHEFAFYGFPLAKTESLANTSIWNDSCTDIYIPLFDEHYMTTGEYVTLKQAYESGLPQANWRDIFSDPVLINNYDPDYQPEPGPGPEDEGDLDNQQLHSIRYNGSNNYYLLTESELTQFIGFINGLYTGESDPDKKRAIDFMGSNPTDYIVGIYGTGIEITGGATTSIKLGAVDTEDAGIFGRAVPTNLTYVNFGNYDIPALNNFLDFKPYTSIEVYVPLCGTVEVDPADYVGHNLKVDGLIDYQTGDLTARIVRDDKTVTNTLSGSMWVQLPVTAAKMGDYQNNQHQLRMQMLSSLLSFGQSSANALNSDAQNAAGAIAGSVAGGSPSGSMGSIGKAQFTIPQNAANTALSLYNTHYQITHTQPARAVASSASSGNALEMYHHAMVFIKRPVFLDGYNAEEYAHTIGHACCISDKLSNFEGYTVAAAADLDNVHTKRELSPLQATAQEKQLLKQALQAGIYINAISPE